MKSEKGLEKGLKGWMILARGMIFVCILVFAGFLTGCADVTVNVHRHLYKPVLPEPVVSFYKGKYIDINSFENMDEGTRRWTYFSPDKKVAYKAAVPLEYYVMDCFRDAFWLAGMGVLKDSPDANIPDMVLIIDRWTDMEFKFTVSILKNNFLKFRNQFVVTMPPSDKTDAAQLEKNSYEMINKAVLAVLSDPKFKEIFR